MKFSIKSADIYFKSDFVASNCLEVRRSRWWTLDIITAQHHEKYRTLTAFSYHTASAPLQQLVGRIAREDYNLLEPHLTVKSAKLWIMRAKVSCLFILILFQVITVTCQNETRSTSSSEGELLMYCRITVYIKLSSLILTGVLICSICFNLVFVGISVTTKTTERWILIA